MRKFVLWFSLVIVFAFQSNAQYASTESDLESAFTVYRKKVKNISVIAISGTLLALTLDESLNNWMRSNQSQFGDGFTNVSNFFGEKYIIVPGVGATWGVAHLIKDERLKRTSWNAVKSIAVTAVATEITKVSVGRARPFIGEGACSFHPFNGADQYKSMPSGHTSLAFAAFTPYAETYSRWIYVVPASVAVARVYKNKHWLSDTVLGAGLGFLSGYIFTHHPTSKIQVSSNGLVFYF